MSHSFLLKTILGLILTTAVCSADEVSPGLFRFQQKGLQMSIYQPPDEMALIKATGQSNSTAPVKAAPKPQECYQFTWPGIDLSYNTSITCRNLTTGSKKNPCFEPFVATNVSSGIPDPEELRTYCEKAGCKVTCPMKSNCVRYTYYRSEKPVNITWFCGVVKDTTDNVPLRYGVNRQQLEGGDVREAFYCDTDLCNSATRLAGTNFTYCFIAISIILAFIN